MPILEPCNGFAFDCFPQQPWVDQLCGPQIWVQPVMRSLCNQGPGSLGEVTSFSGFEAQLGWWMTRTLQRSRNPDGTLDCSQPPEQCRPELAGGAPSNAISPTIGPLISADQFAPAMFNPQPDGTLRADLSTFQNTRYRRPAPGCVVCFNGHDECGNDYPRTTWRWIVPICRIIGFAGYMLRIRATATMPKCVFPLGGTECSGVVMTWRFFPTIASNLPTEVLFNAVGVAYPPAPGATGQDRCDTQAFAEHDIFIPIMWCDQTIDLYTEGPCDAAKAQDCSGQTGRNWPYPWPWDRRTRYRTQLRVDIIEAWLEVP